MAETSESVGKVVVGHHIEVHAFHQGEHALPDYCVAELADVVHRFLAARVSGLFQVYANIHRTAAVHHNRVLAPSPLSTTEVEGG